jgi:uncharacterized protein YecT (DUF1311 family)
MASILALARTKHMKMRPIYILILTATSMLSKTNAQTQLELNQKAIVEDEKSDKKLQSVYRQVIKVYASDTLFVKNLKASQTAWIRYRDLQVKARFPDYPSPYYGSMLPMCVSEYSIQLTKSRIQELEEWLIGDQSDCSSSIKDKEELSKYKN